MYQAIVVLAEAGIHVFFGMKTRIRTSASASISATASRPVVNCPVEVLIAPRNHGAPKPARFAIELISAMPHAAAEPGQEQVRQLPEHRDRAHRADHRQRQRRAAQHRTLPITATR
jgi:hypothetical protein